MVDPRCQVAGQNCAGDKGLHPALQKPLQRPRAVHRVEALVDDQLLGAVGDLQLQGLVGQAALSAADQIVDDAGQVVPGQRAEHYYLVQPVEEFRAERALQLLLHRPLGLVGICAVGLDAVQQYWLPRLEVRMMMVFLKSTVRPWSR
jgi:hypothetical protein